MKHSGVLVLACVAGICPVLGTQSDKNPLGTVLSLMDDLTAKLNKEAEAENKAYNEYIDWCKDTTQNVGFEIKTATSKKGKLEAKIAKLAEEIETGSSKIEDLAASISSDEKDLTDATAVREKEVAEFTASEKELAETVDTLSRAISIIEREMAKNPGAFAQVSAAPLSSLLKVFSSLVDAASFKSADKDRIASLLQAKEDADDEELQPGAPAAKVYKSQSSNILDVLEDMKEKAEEQLNTLRKEEVTTKHNYDMLKNSLESQIKADKKGLAEEKTAKAEAEEGKATAEADLNTAVKDLAGAKEALATASANCMQTAADHDQSMKDRAEELSVIAKAKKILSESTSGGASSFIQMRHEQRFSLRTRADLVGAEVVNVVKKVGKEQHSPALTQLASRMAAVFQYGASSGEDPFEKVKGMLRAMIEKLEKAAGEASEEKAYCDEQMSKTESKQSELDDDVDKLKVKIDSAAASSADLKADVKELQDELAQLAKSQAVMDNERSESHSAFVEAKSELTASIKGVRKALGVLRDYYGSAAASMLQDDQPAVPSYHAKAGGAGGGIIDILEVVESDFAKALAEEEAIENDAQSEYDKMSHENELSKTTKEQDAKYKTQEYKSLDKNIAELKSDLKSTSAELDAVKQYFGQIQDRCVAKPESYETRVERRNAEIKGLKEAMQILENETALTQSRKRGLRSHYIGL